MARCLTRCLTRWAARAGAAEGAASTRRAAPFIAQGRRHYRLMRDHMSAVPQRMLAQLVQMPEVRAPSLTSRKPPPCGRATSSAPNS